MFRVAIVKMYHLVIVKLLILAVSVLFRIWFPARMLWCTEVAGGKYKLVVTTYCRKRAT